MPSTPGYSNLLKGYEDFWEVERKILVGELQPGEGVDFVMKSDARAENREQSECSFICYDWFSFFTKTMLRLHPSP